MWHQSLLNSPPCLLVSWNSFLCSNFMFLICPELFVWFSNFRNKEIWVLIFIGWNQSFWGNLQFTWSRTTYIVEYEFFKTHMLSMVESCLCVSILGYFERFWPICLVSAIAKFWKKILGRKSFDFSWWIIK